MSLITQITDAIRANYILVDRIDAVIEAFEAQTTDIDLSQNPTTLANKLTGILREVTNDKHFALIYRQPDDTPQEEQPRRRTPNFARQNHYFYTAKRLYGNIGYLDFRLFLDSREAMEIAIGAMAMLAHTDALIYDIRLNRGGSPATIQLLLSYLFAEPKHLITFETRTEGENWQTWTLPYVPGRLYTDKPVYVLVSGLTGSGAEEFAYDIQQLERGTLVGQTTMGAGHLVEGIELGDGFSVYISNGRPVNAVSKTGWEDVGVVPDIETAIGDELQTAHLHALQTLQQSADTDEYKRFLDWEHQMATVSYNPYIPDTLSQHVGDYDTAKVVGTGDGLSYLSNGMTLTMTPLADNVFSIRDGDMHLTFEDTQMITEWRDHPDKLVRARQ